jgi:hypothetical protein
MSRMEHDTVNRGDESRRGEHGSLEHELTRCRHPHKVLMADGNSFWCAPCERIVGFLRLPKPNRFPKR